MIMHNKIHKFCEFFNYEFRIDKLNVYYCTTYKRLFLDFSYPQILYRIL